MSPQQYCSDLEGWAPFVFQNIKAYPTKLPKPCSLRNTIIKQRKAKKEQKEILTCLINVGMIYFGQEADLLIGEKTKRKRLANDIVPRKDSHKESTSSDH